MASLGTGLDSTMAVLVSTLNSFVQKDIEPRVYDQVLKHNPVLYRFHRKGKVKSGGASLMWPVKTGSKVHGGSYSGADPLQHGVEDTAQPAEVNWKHYYEDVTIPKTDLLKASGIYAKVDLMKFKFDEAILELRGRVSKDMYSRVSDPTKSLDNLFEAVDDATVTATYAAIAHSNSYWKPGIAGDGQTAAGGAVTSLTTLETSYSQATDGDEQPTLIIATPGGYNFIWGQLAALQRFQRDEEMTKAGFEAFKFNRAVVVVDRNTVAQSMLFLNEAWIDLVSHEDEDWGVDDILPGTPSERSINTKIVWTGNLRVKSIRYHAKITGATNF